MTDDLMDSADCAWDRGHGMCACAAEDAGECLRIRSGEAPDAFMGEACECCCHEDQHDWLDGLLLVRTALELVPLPPVLLAPAWGARERSEA